MLVTLTHKFIAASLLTIVFLATVFVAEARTVVRTGEEVSLDTEQTVEGDFYAAATNLLRISGTIEEDLVAAASRVTVNGTVAGDVFVVGGSVDIHGIAEDDVRVIGGEVVLAEPVMGDVFVIGGSLHILSTASVAGDVIIYGGEATIEGSVGGDVIGTIGSLRIDAAVAGDVNVAVDLLTLGQKSVIEGDVRYTSNEIGIKSPDSVIGGEYMRNDPVTETTTDGVLASSLLPLFVLAFSVLAWFFISRRSISVVVERVAKAPLRVAAIGLLVIFVAPFIIGVLLVSTIGSLVAVVLLFAYVLAVIMSFIALPAVLGILLMKVFNQPSAHLSLLAIAVGIIVLALLTMLPVVGAVVLFGILLLTLGSIIDLLARSSSSD